MNIIHPPVCSLLTVQLCVYIINGRGTPQYPRLTTDECRYHSRHIEGLRNFDDVIVSDEDGETDAGLVSQNQSDGWKHGSREKTIVNSTCTQSIIRFVRITKTIFNVLDSFSAHVPTKNAKSFTPLYRGTGDYINLAFSFTNMIVTSCHIRKL